MPYSGITTSETDKNATAGILTTFLIFPRVTFFNVEQFVRHTAQ